MIDNEIIQRLAYNEGCVLSPYKCSAGKLTIGIGRCLDTNPLDAKELKYIGHDCREKPITKEQAFFLLRNDIEKVTKQLDSNCPWWTNLNYDRQYSMIDLCFQLGISGLMKFKKTLSYLAAGFYIQAAGELLNSNYARQTPARAMRNSQCFKTGVYKC